ncbi:MAG: type II restriction endonuclease [Xanthomonadaceae bacterium]|nr:type II restriction endonuclease [Xanthomonadaceae bacterium]MDP2185908.1 type II restriction endonuclease [Xanthomonadales bacterium]MDZ4116320.1 type II restriction endonuclease [Xanthomonadaceae bacterium]
MFLSASQTRRSRSGRSFEHHVARVFRGGRIRHEEHAVFDDRRPDFVLPDVATLRSKTRHFDEAVVVSLKTILRERWKQLSLERFNNDIFLATVDDRVTAAAISNMAENGIHLLVPESLNKSKET